MDKEHIMDLAKKRARAQSVLRSYQAQNTYGRTPEEKVSDDAKYSLAQSAFFAADRDYLKAVVKLTADELSELAS